MDICYLACAYRTPSGYCGSTGGAATCPHRQKKQTNADRIRSMTDEELATYLDNMQGLAYINGFDSEPIRLYPNNYGAWLDWLRQEAKDG